MNRKIDELGRIVIPKEMRNELGLANGDEAKIELSNNKVIVSNPSRVDLYENWLNEKILELDKLFDNTSDESEKEYILHNYNAYKTALSRYKELRG